MTLPEPTPVSEAAALQEDLGRAGIKPWAWIINASLAAAHTSHPLLRHRAEAEKEQIDRVRNQLSVRYAMVPMQALEPVGVERLRAMCAEPQQAQTA